MRLREGARKRARRFVTSRRLASATTRQRAVAAHSRMRAATFSGVKPKCSWICASGADSPKRSMPMREPASPTKRVPVVGDARLDRDAAAPPGGSTRSRHAASCSRKRCGAGMLTTRAARPRCRRASPRPRPRAPTSEPVAISVIASRRVGLAQRRTPPRAQSSGSNRSGRSSAGSVWRGQRQQRRAVAALEREAPRRGGLEAVGGPHHQQVRDRAQRGEVLDRLVRRAVLAEEDAVVREHPHRLQLHQRGEPDRGPRVVGEHEERRAVRDEAAVSAMPLHDRGHAVLADAEVEVASLEVVARGSTASP